MMSPGLPDTMLRGHFSPLFRHLTDATGPGLLLQFFQQAKPVSPRPRHEKNRHGGDGRGKTPETRRQARLIGGMRSH